MFEPMLPDAPTLLSTMNGWPSCFVRCSESMRARMSVEPPGAHGTISVTGFSGQAAKAGAAAARARAAQARSLGIRRMVVPGQAWEERDSAADRIALHAARVRRGAQHQPAGAVALARAGRDAA